MSDLTLIAHNAFEFTMTTGLTDREALILRELAADEEIDCVVAKQGRIIVFECNEIQEATSLLAELEVVEDIGLIKHITTYEPQWEHAAFLVEFE